MRGLFPLLDVFELLRESSEMIVLSSKILASVSHAFFSEKVGRYTSDLLFEYQDDI